jgi:hypothetical protein
MTAVTAHVAGAPVEELLIPFLATGGTMFLVAARLAFTRARRKATTKRTWAVGSGNGWKRHPAPDHRTPTRADYSRT